MKEKEVIDLASDCIGIVAGVESYSKEVIDSLPKLKCISRVALHAYKIEFMHPTLNKKMNFEAPIPDDFKHISNILNEFR